MLDEAGFLPWIDGVVYIGEDPTAPGLWMPVHLRPDLPSAWVRDALGETALVWNGAVHPLGRAGPIHEDALRAWR